MVELLIALGILLAIGGYFGRRYHQRAVEDAYMRGAQDGQRRETAWACRDAVEQYKMHLSRKLHDAGRQHYAREGTAPSKIHKPRIGGGPIRPSGK